MRLVLSLLIPLAALGQAISNPSSPTDNPNQTNVTTSYLYLNKMHFAGAWSSSITYNAQDVVTYSGSAYLSLAGSNLNLTPSGNPLWWTALGASSSIALSQITQSAATTGMLPWWNGSAWAPTSGLTTGLLWTPNQSQTINGSNVNDDILGLDNLQLTVSPSNNWLMIGTPTDNGPFVPEDFVFVGRNTSDLTSNEEAFRADAEWNGTASSTLAMHGVSFIGGTLSTATGNMTRSGAGNSGGLAGGQFIAQHLGTGTVSQASGVAAVIEAGLASASGTITDAAIFRALRPSVASGTTVTSWAGFHYMPGTSINGTITNHYGIEVDALSFGTNRFAFYAAADPAYFGGLLQMPLTTPGSSSATCTQDTFEYDASYLYVCTATNTWKSVALGAYQLAAVTSVFGRTGAVTAACGDLSNSAASCSTDATNASNISSGTLPHARLPALVSGDIPNNAANTTGNAATATALAATPTLCSAGQVPTGILASGNATGCAAPTVTCTWSSTYGEWIPWMGYASGGTNVASTHLVTVWEFPSLSNGGCQLGHITLEETVSGVHYIAGIMDMTTLTFVAQTATRTSASATVTLAFSSPVTLTAGNPYGLFLADDSNLSLVNLASSGVVYPLMSNTATLRHFTCSNTASGTTTISLPGSCGSRTSSNFDPPIVMFTY